MTALFALAATWNASNPEGQNLIAKLLKGAPKGWRVCYIGAAHGDRGGQQAQEHFKKTYGVKVLAPRLSDPACDVASAREAIESCEVLYLDGGDTVQCVAHARARGVLASFKKAAKNAYLVYGFSAGACATPPYTIGYDDEDNGYIADCMDLGPPLPLDVHEEPDWGEMHAFLELVKKRKDLPQGGIVVPRGSVLIRDRKGKLFSHGTARVEVRRLDKKGAWKIEKLPTWEE